MIKSRISPLQKTLLATIGLVGIMSVAVFAPNALQMLEQVGVLKTKNRQKETVRRSVSRLIHTGLITKNKNNYLELTRMGQEKMREWEFRNHKIEKPKRWDKKWRVLIFDIPEKLKKVRELIRYTLTDTGFVRLEDSVWIYPYECEDFIQLLKTDMGIRKHLVYITAESIEDDVAIKKHFDLE